MDEIYKASSRTSILDTANERVRFNNSDTVYLYTMSMDGLADYSRNAGFVTGSITGTWEPYKRTQVTPEIDAYRFAKYAGTSGISSGTPADITVGTTDVPTLIQEAETIMGDDEVPEEGRILFISETAYAGLKDKITRYVQNGERGIETAIDYYDGMRVIKVESP